MRIKAGQPRQWPLVLARKLAASLLLAVAVFALQVFSPGLVDSASATTLVAGSIYTTVWTAAGSPYLLVDNAVIPAGNTLTIDAGVEVRGVDIGRELTVRGSLVATGTSTYRILFDRVKLISGAGSDADLSRCLFDCRSGGGLGPVSGALNLSDSGLLHAPALVVSFPTSDCVLERNVFRDCDRLFVSPSAGGSVYIRHNLFYKARGAIESWGSVNGDGVDVEGNTFVSPGAGDYPYALKIAPGYPQAGMDGHDNYWETTEAAAIGARIYDRSDDLGCVGYIPFEPFLTAPDAETPALDLTPPTILTGLTTGGWYNFQTLPATSVPDQDLARLECLLDGQPWFEGAQVAEGSHTYAVKAWDTSLNIAETSVDFGVDRTPPTLTTNEDGQPHRVFRLLLTASDAASGVASVEYRVGGGTWKTGTSVTLKCYGKRRGYASGSHTVEYKATDLAGNVTNGSVEVVLAR